MLGGDQRNPNRHGEVGSDARPPTLAVRRAQRSVGSRVRRRGVVLVAASVLAVSAGCGSSDPSASSRSEPQATTPPIDYEALGYPIAADPDALAGPGTELAEGIEVQEGSWRVGTTFPLLDPYDAPGAVTGWQAVILVGDDPIAVWEQYAEQVGIADRATPEASCFATAVDDGAGGPDAEEPLPQRMLTEPPVGSEEHLTCRANTPEVTMTMLVGPTGCPSRRAAPPCEPVAISHLHLQVGKHAMTEPEPYFGADYLRMERVEPNPGPDGWELGPIPEGPIQPPLLPDPLPPTRLPGEGRRFDAGLDHFLGPDHVVPRAARSLVFPAMLTDCNSGLVAVLEVPGAPAAAVRPILEATPYDSATDRGSGELDGAPWSAGGVMAAGGYYLDAIAVETAPGTSTVLVTECGD